ncbi:peptidase domain-containing ABC transporter [Xanthomonas sp. 4461]|uniref:Peptidase domain-containing ABC transporter n=1 Tax=Xanthomonas sp. 10-10 TaxID=3115848 RepID=A0AAU7PBV1_9XANT|nr:peptidase domain-containing ABC transporter [Xanthomonas sp. 4461]MCS3809274.1 ATP-binding cassette subfamily B protein RaxB [Xanthomonas sp. 4461]
MSRKCKTPMIYQAESSECALACLAMVAGYHGLDISLLDLRKRFPISQKGATLRDIVELGEKISLSTRSVRCEMSGLFRLKLPALLHWDFEHFVVLVEARRDKFIVHDPASGVLQMSNDEVSNHFTGIALQLTPSADFRVGREGERFTLLAFLSGRRGIAGYVAQVLWLTLFLETFALLSPFLLKTVIDTGLKYRDLDFIASITIGFAGVALLHGGITLARDYVMLHFSSSFNKQFMSHLIRHMLQLPLSFYSKRSAGDLVDRYQSTNAIRQVLIGALPRVMLDGVIAVVALAIISALSAKLALIAMMTFVVYLLMRMTFFGRTRLLTEKAVRARSEENSHVIETIRGMQPIKIFAKEHERLSAWINQYSRLVEADMRSGLVSSTQSATKVMLLGLDLSASVYLGAIQVGAGQISLGLLFAIFVYKSHFSVKSMAFAEQVMELRLVGLHMDRLSEIALAPIERDSSQKGGLPASFSHDLHVEMIDVTARFSASEGDVLSDVSLDFWQGEFVAITGPSGSGKTTLFKVLLGLIELTRGQIRINGEDIHSYDLQQYRRMFGVVMQDDTLLSGSIIDNIAFFESSPDEERARACAHTALILDEIDAMPMKFNSRIGDLGSALSGGQKQRILLARALYHAPRILLLDEGTANLDENLEHKLLDNLSALGITCLSIAHRPETIRRASRVYHVEAGTVRIATSQGLIGSSLAIQ